MPLPSINSFLRCAVAGAGIFAGWFCVRRNRRGGFSFHRTGGGLQGNKNADASFLEIQFPAQIAHVFHAGLAAFEFNDDLPRLGGFRFVAKKNLAVNALVRAFFCSMGRADETQRLPLEYIFLLLGERGDPVGRGRLADDADKVNVGERDPGRARSPRNEFQEAVGVLQVVYNERNGQLSYVYADQSRPCFSAASIVVPQPQNGSSTTPPGMDAGLDDPLQQRHRLLRRVADAFAAVTTGMARLLVNFQFKSY